MHVCNIVLESSKDKAFLSSEAKCFFSYIVFVLAMKIEPFLLVVGG
jgi:hypothetical protein